MYIFLIDLSIFILCSVSLNLGIDISDLFLHYRFPYDFYWRHEYVFHESKESRGLQKM